MALTQSDLDSLDLAIASSELEVRLEGRLVKYRSTDELIKARDYVAGLINAGTRAQRATYRPNFTTQRDC